MSFELCEYKKYYELLNKRNITIIMGWACDYNKIKEILRFWLLYGELCEYKKYYDYYGVSFVNKRNITIIMGWAL